MVHSHQNSGRIIAKISVECSGSARPLKLKECKEGKRLFGAGVTTGLRTGQLMNADSIPDRSGEIFIFASSCGRALCYPGKPFCWLEAKQSPRSGAEIQSGGAVT